MKKVIFFTLIGLLPSLFAQTYVCYDYAQRVGMGGLEKIGLAISNCPEGYREPSLPLYNRIDQTRESPIITMDSTLITCCRSKTAGETITQWSRNSEGLLRVSPSEHYEVTL